MRTKLSIVAGICAHIALAQPFAIGTTSITFLDAVRNRNIPCELHYPADAAGTDVPASSGTFPVLVISHGFVMTVDAYTYLWQHYVPLGYIVALPTTEGGFTPDHAAFGADLAYIANALQSANTDVASLFFGHVTPATALMGHSMGGGAAFLGAAGNANIQTLVTLSPAETNPSAITAAAQVLVPTLVFAASEDCVTPIATNTQPMYNELNVACKAFLNITGGGHCYFGDSNTLCTFGEFTCAPNLGITRDQQHDVVTDITDLWLDHHLRGSSPAFSDLLDSLSNSTRFQAMNTCLSTSVVERPATTFTARYNADERSLSFDALTIGAELECINALGAVVAHTTVRNSTMTLSLRDRGSGLCCVRECIGGRCGSQAIMIVR